MHPAAAPPPRTALEAAQLFAPAFRGETGEVVQVAILDREGRMLALEQVASVPGMTVGLPMRQLIARALELKAEVLILAHNHPSGDPTPSRADMRATRALVDVVRPLGIRVADHLVFGSGGRCTSFRQLGLL